MGDKPTLIAPLSPVTQSSPPHGGGPLAYYTVLSCYELHKLRPLQMPIYGSLIFLLLNLYFGRRLSTDRLATLTKEEQRMYTLHFQSSGISKSQFKKMSNQGELVVTDNYEDVMAVWQTNKGLFMVIDGTIEVRLESETKGDTGVIEMGAGSFFGEMTFLGEAHIASAQVVAAPGSRYMHWKDVCGLRESLKAEPVTSHAMEMMIGKSFLWN